MAHRLHLPGRPASTIVFASCLPQYGLHRLSLLVLLVPRDDDAADQYRTLAACIEILQHCKASRSSFRLEENPSKWAVVLQCLLYISATFYSFSSHHWCYLTLSVNVYSADRLFIAGKWYLNAIDVVTVRQVGLLLKIFMEGKIMSIHFPLYFIFTKKFKMLFLVNFNQNSKQARMPLNEQHLSYLKEAFTG